MSSCPALAGLESSTALPVSNSSSVSLVRLISSIYLWSIQRLKRGGRLALGAFSSVWLLMSCKALIGAVAAFDTYLTIKYAESLDIYEQNPLGRWLMGLDQGPVCETQQIAAFITAKFVGTLLVLMAIQGLAYWRVRVAGLVATPVAMAQLYLVVHLVFGEG